MRITGKQAHAERAPTASYWQFARWSVIVKFLGVQNRPKHVLKYLPAAIQIGAYPGQGLLFLRIRRLPEPELCEKSYTGSSRWKN